MEDSVLNLCGLMLTLGGQCHSVIAAQTSWVGGGPEQELSMRHEPPMAYEEQWVLTGGPDNRASKAMGVCH